MRCRLNLSHGINTDFNLPQKECPEQSRRNTETTEKIVNNKGPLILPNDEMRQRFIEYSVVRFSIFSPTFIIYTFEQHSYLLQHQQPMSPTVRPKLKSSNRAGEYQVMIHNLPTLRKSLVEVVQKERTCDWPRVRGEPGLLYTSCSRFGCLWLGSWNSSCFNSFYDVVHGHFIKPPLGPDGDNTLIAIGHARAVR